MRFLFEVYESSAMNYKIKEILSFVKIREKCNRKNRDVKIQSNRKEYDLTKDTGTKTITNWWK